MNQKSHTVQKQVDRLMAVMTGIVITLVLSSLFCTSWLITQLLRPLSVLSQAVRQVGKGDWKIRIPQSGHDEISKLAGDFNIMTAHLDEYRNSSLGDLLLAKRTAQSAIDSLPDPVLICDVDNNPIHVNTASERILGLSHEHHSLEHLPVLLMDRVQRIREYILSGKGEYAPRGFGEAIRLVIPGKKDDFWFLVHGNPLYDDSKNIAGITILFKDVTRLYHFDELKRDLVTEVIHELRTPLLSLETAIHVCLEGIAGNLNDKQTELLSDARFHCQHIKDHLDELIDFSKLSSDMGIPIPEPHGEKS